MASDVLFDPTKVDIVSSAPDGTTAELYIVADAPWSGSDAQIRSLQDKIHAYVGFAVDGQMVQLYPELASMPWRIVIRCLSGRPDVRTANVLAGTIERVRGHGGDLEVRPSPPVGPQPGERGRTGDPGRRGSRLLPSSSDACLALICATRDR